MIRKRLWTLLLASSVAASLFFTGCGAGSTEESGSAQEQSTELSAEEAAEENTTTANAADTEDAEDAEGAEASAGDSADSSFDSSISYSADVSLVSTPEYTGDPYVEIHANIPYFSDDEKTTEVFEDYSDLDSLGRCGTAYANICPELMPTEERGDISSIYPSGWDNNPYDFVDGQYVYNRCHLIGYQLAGENANEKNLITGTRYMNVEGMLPFENMVADYVKETDNHVLYRVTPLFDGDNLVASGVLMEAWSVEDDGDGICFCVYCFNVQPGVEIDYATGENWADGTYETSGDSASSASSETEEGTKNSENSESGTYILNTNTKKFHRPTCSSVDEMSDKNKEEYTGSRAELIEEGYSPCQRCNP
ncbi:MAG: DNA/RNA non-specific endonuclease [Clostridiales bacterium]|nr:DNA/RNA non-specific endonuclease [Clostridiales bacterium]